MLKRRFVYGVPRLLLRESTVCLLLFLLLKCMPTCQKDYMRIFSWFRVFDSTWKLSKKHVVTNTLTSFFFVYKRRTQKPNCDCASFSPHRRRMSRLCICTKFTQTNYKTLIYIHVKIAEMRSTIDARQCARNRRNRLRYVISVSFGGCESQIAKLQTHVSVEESTLDSFFFFIHVYTFPIFPDYLPSMEAFAHKTAVSHYRIEHSSPHSH